MSNYYHDWHCATLSGTIVTREFSRKYQVSDRSTFLCWPGVDVQAYWNIWVKTTAQANAWSCQTGTVECVDCESDGTFDLLVSISGRLGCVGPLCFAPDRPVWWACCLTTTWATLPLAIKRPHQVKPCLSVAMHYIYIVSTMKLHGKSMKLPCRWWDFMRLRYLSWHSILYMVPEFTSEWSETCNIEDTPNKTGKI